MNYAINLSNLAQATEQEVFDQVVNHLRAQKVQSKQQGMCAYRGGEDGKLMCAAGCLISDEEYKANDFDLDFDGQIGQSWGEVVDRGFAPERHMDLIDRLQSVHDEYDATPADWEKGFKRVAYDFDLQYTKENENE